jgi:hypothetical protein
MGHTVWVRISIRELIVEGQEVNIVHCNVVTGGWAPFRARGIMEPDIYE